MSEITLFSFPATGQQVRVIGDHNRPLIHHGDACKILEHSNPSVAIRMVDEDERVKIDMRSISAGQTALNGVRAPLPGPEAANRAKSTGQRAGLP